MCINDMHAQQAKNHLIISNGMIMEGVPEVSSVQEGNLSPCIILGSQYSDLEDGAKYHRGENYERSTTK